MLQRHDRSQWKREALTLDNLRSKAPAIFAESAMEGVSNKYRFFPTVQLIDAVQQAGWVPVHVIENRVRQEERKGFQKHMVRFHQANPMALTKIGDTKLELSLINSHDRSSGCQLHAGVFRLICLNGMMVADSILSRMKISHVGVSLDEVIKLALEISDAAPTIGQNIEMMKARVLTPVERIAFAQSALILRYDEPEQAPVSASRLLTASRREDEGSDMWSTLNVVQENLLKGGQRGTITNPETHKRRNVTSRTVKAISEDVRLNKALWHLAETLRKGGNPVEAATA